MLRILQRNLLKICLPFLNLKHYDELIRGGHKLICESGDLEMIRNVRDAICKFENERLSALKTSSFNKFATVPEVASRFTQRRVSLLLTRIEFVKCLSFARATNSKCWYPLPNAWIKIANQNGLQVNCVMSKIMYQFLNCILMIKKCWEIGHSIINESAFLQSEFFQNDEWFFKGAVVVGIAPEIIGARNNLTQQEFFGDWLRGSSDRQQILGFTDSEKLAISESMFPQSSSMNYGFFSRLHVAVMAIKFFYFRRSTYSFKVFKFLNFSELLLFIRIFRSGSNLSTRMLFFNNSQSLSKPLWTSLFENLGSRICLVFYSSEEEPNYLSGTRPKNELWQLSRWKECWVIDEVQKSELVRINYLPSTRFIVIGMPWWTDSDVTIPIIEGKSIALFDLEPHLGHFGLTTYNSYGSQDPIQASTLLKQVVDVCLEFGLTVLHKPKRNIGLKRYDVYKDNLEVLKNIYPNNYRLIDPSVAPSRLIRSTDATVCVPFTSPAIIAMEMGHPATYFTCNPKTPLFNSRYHELECINSKEKLKEWLIGVLAL